MISLLGLFVSCIEKFIEFGKHNANKKKLIDTENKINENDIYSILYTSGTEKNPKGVMLSHKGQLAVINNIIERTNIKDGYKTIHYLPLSNSFGRFINYACQISGLRIYYQNEISTLQKNILEINPDFSQ